jgi:DNA-binding transcriptional ArsR family regulator
MKDLPSYITSQLEIRTTQALQHQYRRDILRALQAAGQSMSPAQLLRIVKPDLPLSSGVYHVRRLAEVGLVTKVGEKCEGGKIERYYAPQIADNYAVKKLLRATETEDALNSAASSN